MAKTTLQVSIPKPCHEDWAKMTPTQCGAFCQACQKEVVDFSRMSEAEIVDRLSKASGKVCGRIPATMLNRELVKHEPDLAWYSWKKWAVAAGVLLGAGSAKGNTYSDTITKPKIDTVVLEPVIVAESCNDAPRVIGMLVERVEPIKVLQPLSKKDTITVRGRITDINNEPVDMAFIIIDTTTYTYTDIDGYYALAIPQVYHNKAVELHVRYVGYSDTAFVVVANESKKQDIKLTQQWESFTMGLFIEAKPRHKIRRFFHRIGNAFRKPENRY
ncbi:MAG: carboxypeptidase-like regulatory domain-containing protein [Bacteroidetes bacterium]|nr:carboxypeptidase-like regulatory domain-containing protein [Bacteroidota bacterium]